MVKFLPVVVLLIMVSSVLWWWRSQDERPIPATASSLVTQTANQQTPDVKSLEQRLAIVEQSLTKLVRQSAGSATVSSPPQNLPDNTDLEARITALETAVSGLRNQALSPTGTTSTKKSPLYIPLGWTGGSTGTDWTAISSQEILLDPADYPGYTSIQFEGSIRAYQGNGRAYARILNNTDGTALIASEISTTNQDFTWVSSGQFSLPGKKTYRLQLKSLTGYEAGITNARLKINF